MSYVTRKYHDKKIKAKDAEIAELKKDVEFWRDKAPEDDKKLLSEAEHDRNYYKRLYNETKAKLDEKTNAENTAQAMGEAKSNKRREAAYAAHAELAKVKANEDQCTVFQRAIGAAQGILAAVLDVEPVNLYPGDEPPMRRASDQYRRDMMRRGGMPRHF